MSELKIIAVFGTSMAFRIDGVLWYISINQIPRIFDHNCVKQIVYNTDGWFQNKTQQRYSYRTVLDMMDAYTDGFNSAYTPEDFANLIDRTVRLTARHIFSKRANEYITKFWVESLNPQKLEDLCLREFSVKFDYYRDKYGDKLFHEYICRLHAIAQTVKPNLLTSIEVMIEKLSMPKIDNLYPDTSVVDNKVVEYVASLLINSVGYKNVDTVVIRNIVYVHRLSIQL